jgi:hypothetical protein
MHRAAHVGSSPCTRPPPGAWCAATTVITVVLAARMASSLVAPASRVVIALRATWSLAPGECPVSTAAYVPRWRQGAALAGCSNWEVCASFFVQAYSVGCG